MFNLLSLWKQSIDPEMENKDKYVYVVFDSYDKNFYPLYPILRDGPEHTWLKHCYERNGKFPRSKLFRHIKKLHGFSLGRIHLDDRI